MMSTPDDDKQPDVGESAVLDVTHSSIGNLDRSLSRLDDIFRKETANGSKDLDKDLVSLSSGSVSRRLSDRLAGRVSKFNANPTDGSFLSPMQSSMKKKVRNHTRLRRLEFSPEPRRLHPTKTMETRIKNFDGSTSKRSFVRIDLRSPQDVKKLVESSRDNQRLGQILHRYEKLAGGNPQHRRDLTYKMLARERHRHHDSTAMSEEERARLLKLNRARLYRSGSERILETDLSPKMNASDDALICDNVWAVQCDFTNFVSPSFEKTETQRNLILGVIERSFVFAEFRKYGRARCEGALEKLVGAFESVSFPSGHVLLHSGMRKENDKFYLVERGRIEFKIDGRPVAQINEVGGYYGELSLLHNVVSERTVSVYRASGSEASLLKINQKTFRGILNTCSKQAAQEKREALLSVNFLSEIIKENEKMIRQLSSIMIREEMNLDGVFNLSQNNTFVVIRSGQIRVTESNEMFDAGDHFGSRALIQTLPTPSQSEIDMIACSENVVFFKIENHAMGQIVGQSRLQNLMDMHRFAATRLIEKSNLSSDAHELMADTIAERKVGNDEDSMWEVDKNDPPAVYIVREGSLNVSTHDKSTGNQIETLVTAGNIFGLDQLKLSTKNGKMMYKRCGGLKASIPSGQSTSIGVLPLNEAKTPIKSKTSSSTNDIHIGHCEHKETSNPDWGSSPSSILQLRAMVQEAVESNISLQDLEKIRLLGEGEFGEVWLVAATVLRKNSTTMKQKFALKTQIILDDSRGVDATDVILREIQIMKELNHPQVTDLVTTYQDETSIHMLMRVIPYGELWDRMHREDHQGNWSSGLPDDHAKFYAISIADTLNFIHSRGIIYRDLKPENVLVDVDGYPVIVDFGCSKFCPDKSYTFVGTPNYVAPEMITNAGHNKGVDIWAFGVMVYEMVAGENPFFFEGMDQISLYHSICHEKHFPLSEDKNKECIDFVGKLLKKNPIERLGMLHAGINDILQHRWFDGIELEKIRAKSFPAPWTPTDLVCDGFEDFELEVKESARSNNSSISINESMESYSSVISTEEMEVQELSHSSGGEVHDSVNSLSSVFSTEEVAEIRKLSSSSRSKPGNIQFSSDSFSSSVSIDESGEAKETSTSSTGDIQEPNAFLNSKEKKRKKKPKKQKSKEQVSNRLGSNSNSYDDPFEFQFLSIKHSRAMRNPTVRMTMSKKKERQTRRDLLKNSFDNFGID